MATSKPATNVLGRLRFGALSAIGPRLVPCRPGGVSSVRQVADIRGGGKKRKNEEEPLACRAVTIHRAVRVSVFVDKRVPPGCTHRVSLGELARSSRFHRGFESRNNVPASR